MQGVRWALACADHIQMAGGVPSGIINRMPDELITTMVHNSLYVTRKVKF